MPGPASHMFIADKVRAALEEISDEDILAALSDGDIVNLIDNHNDYYKMGSTGPDLFFFAPDYDIVGVPAILASFFKKVYGPIRDLYRDTIKPIDDALGEIEDGVNKGIDALTCNSVSTVRDRVGELNESLSGLRDSFMIYVFSESFNMFDEMRAPLQKDGVDEDKWFWFDILHYRRTGKFVQKMWQKANTDEARAYVLGYATHIAADVSGHPFVNQVVGGPARSHNQRHHFVENIIDTWFYDKAMPEPVNVTDSKLHLQLPYGSVIDNEDTLLAILNVLDLATLDLTVNLDPSVDADVDPSSAEAEGSIAAALNAALESEDIGKNVPDDLRSVFETVSVALDDVFEENHWPGYLDAKTLAPEHINLTYWLFLISLKVSTDSYIEKPREPFGEILDDINEAMAAFLEKAKNPPKPPSSIPAACFSLTRSDCDFSLDSLTEWLEFMWDNIAYQGELLAWVAEVLSELYDVVACGISAPFKATAAALLWLMHSAIYAILEEVRSALVMAAIIHPQPEWVENTPLAQDLVEIPRPSPVHTRVVTDEDNGVPHYPHRAQASNEGFLRYPETPIEGAPTIAGPYPPSSTPLSFVEGGPARPRTISPDDLYRRYADSTSPSNTIETENAHLYHETFSTVDLAHDLFRILKLHTNEGSSMRIDIPDWNLDADRGFHYKNWSANWENLAHDETVEIAEEWRE